MTAVTWAVIVPVKSASDAKTRLASVYGRWRPHLARAFALDTIAAAAACSRADRVVVVTDDAELADLVGCPRVSVVVDHRRAGVNAAVLAGLETVSATSRVAVLTSDLPSLTANELAATLDLAANHDTAVVGDREGVGTTLLCARVPALLTPRFGPDSLRLHRAGGAVDLLPKYDSAMSRDVDLPAHLQQAYALGVGPATAHVLDRIQDGTGPLSDPVPPM